MLSLMQPINEAICTPPLKDRPLSQTTGVHSGLVLLEPFSAELENTCVWGGGATAACDSENKTPNRYCYVGVKPLGKGVHCGVNFCDLADIA
jgi:hypothetical protein